MRRVFIILMAAALVLAPSVTSAATFRAGDNYRLPFGQTVTDDLYVGSGDAVVDGIVDGDIVIGGGDVFLSGRIMQDAVIAGGTVHIRGWVEDDVRAVGGKLDIEGIIGDDVMAAGGRVHVLPEAVISGDMSVAGGRVVIDGTIDGDVSIMAGEVEINGVIHGKVRLTADKISIGHTAILDDGLTYKSPREADIGAGAQIIGTVQYTNNSREMGGSGAVKGFLVAALGIAALLKFAMYLVLVLAGVLLFRSIPSSMTERVLNKFWPTVGIGFIMIVLVPVVALICFSTILGIPVGILLFLGYIGWLIVANALAAMIFGGLIHRSFTKTAAATVDWKTALGGAVMLYVISGFPIIGKPIYFVFLLAALGGLGRTWYQNVWTRR